MIQKRLEHKNNPKIQTTSLLGLMLIMAGVMFILDLQLKTKWLTISIPAILGLVLLIYGFASGTKGWLIGGGTGHRDWSGCFLCIAAVLYHTSNFPFGLSFHVYWHCLVICFFHPVDLLSKYSLVGINLFSSLWKHCLCSAL